MILAKAKLCMTVFLPTVRRRQVTAGVAKQANTSSVLEKCVLCGKGTA